MANNETGCPKSILPTESINDLPQVNSFSQNSHINVKFINVDSVEKYDDQIKKDQSFKSKNSKKGGGITCCVPLCYSNSRRNPELSYYIIPKDSKWKRRWLAMISRKDFTPTAPHRVCYLHLHQCRLKFHAFYILAYHIETSHLIFKVNELTRF